MFKHESEKREYEKAKWICGGNKFCRRYFVLEEKPMTAELSIMTDPHMYQNDQMVLDSFLKYRLFLNGKQFAVGPFRSPDNIPVLHEFDVSALLERGDNVLGGIFRTNARGFALILKITLTNGVKLLICSDSQWRQLDADSVFESYAFPSTSLYGPVKNGPGEYFDHINGSRYPSGWEYSEYDDSSWNKVEVNEPCQWPFEFHRVTNYELKLVSPREIVEMEEGRFFIDFGHELIAGIELDAPVAPGKVEIRLGEELTLENQVRYEMRTGNHYINVWNFFPENKCLANFSLHAFRYAEIIGWHGKLSSENIRAIAVNMPFNDKDSKFSCSSPKLENVWNLCKNTIKYTTMDVYQDCPSRERIAYEADSYINMLTHFSVEGNTTTAKRTFAYLLKHPTWPCEWRQFMIPMAYEYLMHTGDYDLIERNFDFLCNNCSFHQLINNGLIKTFPMKIIIDWPECYRDNYEIGDNCAVPNAFAYYDLVLLAKLSRLLCRNGGDKYLDLAAQIKAAFNSRLYDDRKCLYRDGSDSKHCSFHSNMFALCFGLVPDERIASCINYLEQKGMICSVYAAQFYLETLFKYDRAEVAIGFMVNENLHSSWLGMIAQGATATMEAWHPDGKPNLSWAHPWATAPANIITRYLFGLRPKAPGWKEFECNPKPGCLKSGNLAISTPRGKISVNFKRNNEGSDISIIISLQSNCSTCPQPTPEKA